MGRRGHSRFFLVTEEAGEKARRRARPPAAPRRKQTKREKPRHGTQPSPPPPPLPPPPRSVPQFTGARRRVFITTSASVQIKPEALLLKMGSTEVPIPVPSPEIPAVNGGSAAVAPAATDSKPKKKICCACPDTKRLRDECVVEHGEAACAKWIEAHKRCLRAEGFNV